MLNLQTIREFKTGIENELIERILPFWMEKTVDPLNGGFYGRITNDLQVDDKADKGCILNSRILWTFSAAYRLLKDERYLAVARRAFDYLLKYFWDEEYSGLFFTVDYLGRVTEPRKLTYNLSFGIYGFSEFYRATGVSEALERAIRLYRLIEKNCRDQACHGYFECCSREWRVTHELQMGGNIDTAKKTMNTHLHLLEAYTNLWRVWQDRELRGRITDLLTIMNDFILDPDTRHFKLYFDEAWNSKREAVSFGHDIEGSWLVYETATELGDESLQKRITDRIVGMAQTTYEEGLDPKYGGLFFEMDEGELLTVKVWWAQCEAMVGFLNAFELTGREYFFEAALGIWRFTDRYLTDRVHGEWFGMVSREGYPDYEYEKVGPWKCPYHNSRACMEIMARLERYMRDL